MKIGSKIKQLRLKLNLTQEELADRSELSKGFISQVERDITSPSIATLVDILECLGTNLKDFFNETIDEKVVFHEDDIFIKEYEESGCQVAWLVTSAQKNQLEPIMLILKPGGQSYEDGPHEGEEFGYVMNGSVSICLGQRKFRAKKGDSFYFRPLMPHYIENIGKNQSRILWVTTPPSF